MGRALWRDLVIGFAAQLGELRLGFTQLAALFFFDDKDKGGDVMSRLNQFGKWAGDLFKNCNEGTHKGFAGDLQGMIRDTERLAVTLADLK